jgi:hypothetical protein
MPLAKAVAITPALLTLSFFLLVGNVWKAAE